MNANCAVHPLLTQLRQLRQILKHESEAEIYYLLGADNVSSLSKWHRFSDLEKLVHFMVLDRGGSATQTFFRSSALPDRHFRHRD